MRTISTYRSVAATALLTAATCLAFAPGVRDWTISALKQIEQLGPSGPAVFVAVYVVATLCMLPGALLTIGAGALFGLWGGTAAVVVGSNLGATAAFLLGRTLLRDWAEAMVRRHPMCSALDQAVADNGFRIVLLTRLSPLFPFNCLNYAFGLTRLSIRDYVGASIVGMLPGTFLFVYVGAGVRSLATIESRDTGGLAGQLMFAGGLVAALVVTAYFMRVARSSVLQQQPMSTEIGVADKFA
jgi:uncharacterized membrane protein YdjX (TVP38/TMEM64 family)